MWKLGLACQQILDQCKCFFKVPRSHEFLKFNMAGVCEKLVHWAVQQHTLARSLDKKTPLCLEEHTTVCIPCTVGDFRMHGKEPSSQREKTQKCTTKCNVLNLIIHVQCNKLIWQLKDKASLFIIGLISILIYYIFIICDPGPQNQS